MEDIKNLRYPSKDTSMFWYKPNWKADLHKRNEPILQPWQILKMRHKPWRYLGLAPWQDRTPAFYAFSGDKAYAIAHTLPLLSFALWFGLIAITLAYHNFQSILWWILAGTIGFPFFIQSINCLRQLIAEVRVKRFIGYGMSGVHAIVVDGKVGAGKTSSLLESYTILAKTRWEQICQAVRLLLPFEEDIPYWRADLRKSAEEILESYYFFLDSGTVPLLYTSVPAMVDGMFTNKLQASHLMQEERLPYGAVIIIDESALVLPQKLYTAQPYALIEFFKFLRHDGDFYVGATEQDENSNLIYLRRACGKVVHVIEQEHILKSRLLQWIYDFLNNHIKNMTQKKAGFLHRFKKIIDNFGFRKYYYKEYLGGDEESGRIKSFVVKPSLSIKYNSRSYKNVYRCKDKPLKVSTWMSLYLTEQELKEVFSNDLKDMAKSKAQIKREATERRLAKKSQ